MNFIIPYGAAALDWTRISIADDGAVACPSPHVRIEPGSNAVLRRNGGQYAFAEAPDLRTMTDASIQAEYLRHHLSGFCDLWNKPAARFLHRYFDFIEARVDAHKAALIEGLAPFGGIYAYRDWMLSAPRPLPRAWIKPAVGDAPYIAIDFAFWLGNRLVAVLMVGSATPTKRDRERKDALSAAGVEIIEVTAQDDLADKLPPDFQTFWRDERLPSSPFKGSSLGDIISR